MKWRAITWRKSSIFLLPEQFDLEIEALSQIRSRGIFNVPVYAATATAEMALLGAVFMAMTFVVFLGYGAFAAKARDWVLGSARVMTWLNRSFAAVFALLAGRLAMERA